MSTEDKFALFKKEALLDKALEVLRGQVREELPLLADDIFIGPADEIRNMNGSIVEDEEYSVVEETEAELTVRLINYLKKLKDETKFCSWRLYVTKGSGLFCVTDTDSGHLRFSCKGENLNNVLRAACNFIIDNRIRRTEGKYSYVMKCKPAGFSGMKKLIKIEPMPKAESTV